MRLPLLLLTIHPSPMGERGRDGETGGKREGKGMHGVWGTGPADIPPAARQTDRDRDPVYPSSPSPPSVSPRRAGDRPKECSWLP